MGFRALPPQLENKELLRFSTIGSVDDGKSTLIARLLVDSQSINEDELASIERASAALGRETELAFLLDGLRAEREQGITIDVAHRYFSTSKRRFIIADSPGHEQYTRNMVVGAAGSNLSIILIDARKGVSTQTKRHAFIVSLLSVPHLVVAVNKMDLVDYDETVFNQIKTDFTEFSGKLNITDVRFVPVSALEGDNVARRSSNMPWYTGETVLELLKTIYIAGDRNLVDLRVPVQFVIRPHKDFRGFGGQVKSGVLRRGEEIMVLPGRQITRIRELFSSGTECEEAFPPMSVTFVLEDELDISRGDMIVRPKNRPMSENRFSAMLVWMGEKPFERGRPLFLRHTTKTCRARIERLEYCVDVETLSRREVQSPELNQIVRAVVRSDFPLFIDSYRKNRATGSFILIDGVSNATVAAGMIIDRVPPEKYRVDESFISRTRGEDFKTIISGTEREKRFGHKAFTLWFTGLPGSGKSTISKIVERKLFDSGHNVYLLDGDEVRSGLNRDLGFSSEDRGENIRRAAEVAHMFNEAGIIALASFVSPFEKDRKLAKEIIGEENFIEVFVGTSREVCEKRDPKGFYEKARVGEISEFTGVSSPYEKPLSPDITVTGAGGTPQESANVIIEFLKHASVLQ